MGWLGGELAPGEARLEGLPGLAKWDAGTTVVLMVEAACREMARGDGAMERSVATLLCNGENHAAVLTEASINAGEHLRVTVTLFTTAVCTKRHGSSAATAAGHGEDGRSSVGVTEANHLPHLA